MRSRIALSADINKNVVEEQVPIDEIGVWIVYSVDDDGVLFPSQDWRQCTCRWWFRYAIYILSRATIDEIPIPNPSRRGELTSVFSKEGRRLPVQLLVSSSFHEGMEVASMWCRGPGAVTGRMRERREWREWDRVRLRPSRFEPNEHLT